MPSETPGAGSAEPQTDWEALARYLAGESPAEEQAAVQRWLGSNPADARMIAALDDALGSLASGPNATTGINVEAALAKVNALRTTDGLRLVQGSASAMSRGLMHRGSASRWLPYAAAAALVIAIGTLVWRDRVTTPDQPTKIAARTITTPIGGRDSLVLPDGSHVILGAGTELTIAAGYGQSTRAVAVRGEAYFDVRHDAAVPFVVSANGTVIRDIGTAFVVRSDSAGGVRVAVTVGVVEMTPRSASGVTVLNAGDVATVSPAGDIAAERGAGTADDLAWTRGKLVFRDTPLSEVRDDLRRWYGIHLDVRDPVLLRRPLSASFEGDSIKRVLDVISLALGASIERRGDTAVVRLAPGASRRP